VVVELKVPCTFDGKNGLGARGIRVAINGPEELGSRTVYPAPIKSPLDVACI